MLSSIPWTDFISSKLADSTALAEPKNIPLGLVAGQLSGRQRMAAVPTKIPVE